ncbi:MAG TPA: DUF1015 domain-containing protein [Tepidisphaeraceae bacterium]|nr:DUF1015 domain-containing protein [Tepidisphaeraceae bacterium]
MADIRPFHAIRYADRLAAEHSNLIAPPYDVLDAGPKKALQDKHPNNVVTIDLPFTPPKTVGPDSVYEQANLTMQAWLSAGILQKDRRPAMYPYAQSYQHHGKTFHRRGFIVLVKLTPFGEDVIPHEKTYAGPIEDRLKLMHATGAQLSPVFGLFSDPRNEVTRLLYSQVGKPQATATMDGVTNQLWSVIDAEIERQVIDLMDDKKIYIADGHHRYTTALHYQKQMIQRNGGKPLAISDPANYCMFVLVAMQDDGLLILPTHRMLQLETPFDLAVFKAALGEAAIVTDVPVSPEEIERWTDEQLPKLPAHTFGLYDGATRMLHKIEFRDGDVLKKYEPDRSPAWRKLDVAILQRYLVEEIIQPRFTGGKEAKKGYSAYAKDIVPMTDGQNHHIALITKSTPLHALEELGKVGEVMPQKSTFFVPKLATGMTINPLR